MKRTAISISLLLVIAMVACDKNDTSVETTTTELQSVATSLQAVAVGVSSRQTGDSVYVVNACKSNEKFGAISFENLPEVSSNYLSENYEGYESIKAFAILDSTGTTAGYIAIIRIDEALVGITFDADGNFVKVLEQVEGRNLSKHKSNGGKRNGHSKEKISVDSIPATIVSYLASNYPTDTLLYAFTKKNGSYIVITQNESLYASLFDSSGTFISHTAINVSNHKGKLVSLDASALPAAIVTYLTSTYPGYTVDKAFVHSRNSEVAGYIVIIEANETKYAIAFGASGNFLKVKTVR